MKGEFIVTNLQPSNVVIPLNIQEAVNPRHLELYVLPTEQCNFRCTYCYEDFKVGRMGRTTIEAVKLLITERMNDLRTFKFSWFGGEPLVAKDIIYELSEFAIENCEKHSVTFLGGDVTTNGYLLSVDVFEKLISLNQKSFQISLDGWGSEHDQTRPLASGKPTFTTLWNNIIAMCSTKLDFELTLRLHVSPSNQESLGELVQNIRDKLLPDSRITVFFKAIGNWGGPNAGKFNVLDRKSSAVAISHLKSQLNARRGAFRAVNWGEGMESRENGPGENFYICYAAKPNTLMIRADGTIGKCTVALNDPRNSVGKLNDDGSIAFRDERLKAWFHGYQDLSASKLGCPLSYVKNLPIS